jgi:cell wall-associated NlpC family hydrolase
MRRSHDTVLHLLLVCGIPTALGACTLVGGGVQPAATPGPMVREPVTAARDAPAVEVAGGREAERIAGRVVDTALASIGTPYEWGGSDANGFDCSGLIRYAYGKFGIALPRTSAGQIRSGRPVAPDPGLLRPGDILGFSGERSGATDHVGLYVGSDEFIHSSSSGVRISTLRNPYWREHLAAARRIVE